MMGAYNKGNGRGIRWLRAHISHNGDDCLIWPFGRDDKGYGTLGHNKKVWKASRMMCKLVHGDPPTPEHHAAHSCGMGHTGCVHPKHVSWKTPSENQVDSVRHGTHPGGVGRNGKLSKTQVSEIKGLQGRLTNLELGLIYGVHAETIAKIRRGETWRKVA